MNADATDARRYRWLRRKIDPDTVAAVIADDFDLRESQCRDVDSAIDAELDEPRYELTDAGEGT